MLATIGTLTWTEFFCTLVGRSVLHHLQAAGRERGSEEYAVKQAVVVERAIRQQRSARMLCERVRDRQVRHHASRHLLFEDQSQSFLLLGKRKSPANIRIAGP